MNCLRPTIIALLALAALLLVSGGSALASAATTFTVNSTADPGHGVCDATECTLREAIAAGNATAGTDTIALNIPGAGAHTIQPAASSLPTIVDPLVIDGYSQPGASPNTNPAGLGTNAVLKIELDGSMAGTYARGLNIAAGNSTVRGLVVNRFWVGIYLLENGGNRIQGNYVGTDVAGASDVGNSNNGLWITSPENTIGGTTAPARNIISGNGNFGVVIQSAGNLFQGNLVGTDFTGTVPIGNSSVGVGILGPNNKVGGSTEAARNVISANHNVGVSIQSGTGNLVQGNFIGTDVTGTLDLGNAVFGVSSIAPNSTVGGTTAREGNVISGNDAGGVNLRGTGNHVLGNCIGTDVTGTVNLGNSGYGGVYIDGDSNAIGDTAAGARNVISGNNSYGVFISGSGNQVQGNLIGTDLTGTVNLGNAKEGVDLHWGENNTIGGNASGAGNTVAFNGRSGVRVSSYTGNLIGSNSIHSNTGLGIDLEPHGVTPNDAGDGDTGANNLQNFPVLTSIISGSTTLEGTLNSTANTAFRLEFFSSSACDPSGHGEGELFIGSTHVTTDGSGNADFAVTFADTIPTAPFITATATDPDNNTSEFSRCIRGWFPVGGIVELQTAPPESLQREARDYTAPIAAAVVAGALALAWGAWCARRRWLP